jgi:hypothetical protein
MEWWIKTPYAESLKPNEHLNWISTKQRARFWTAYVYCAESNSGKPTMECSLCYSIFGHPQLIVNGQCSGNSALDRQFKDSCPFSEKHGNNSTPPITPPKVRQLFPLSSEPSLYYNL